MLDALVLALPVVPELVPDVAPEGVLPLAPAVVDPNDALPLADAGDPEGAACPQAERPHARSATQRTVRLALELLTERPPG